MSILLNNGAISVSRPAGSLTILIQYQFCLADQTSLLACRITPPPSTSAPSPVGPKRPPPRSRTAMCLETCKESRVPRQMVRTSPSLCSAHPVRTLFLPMTETGLSDIHMCSEPGGASLPCGGVSGRPLLVGPPAAIDCARRGQPDQDGEQAHRRGGAGGEVRLDEAAIAEALSGQGGARGAYAVESVMGGQTKVQHSHREPQAEAHGM